MTDSASTALANYYLALLLRRDEEHNAADIKSHVERLLNLGMDPTPEAIEILGDNHISVHATNRVEWRQHCKEITAVSTTASSRGGRGGIIGSRPGEVVGMGPARSIVSPLGKGADGNGREGGVSETMSILEQGAI